MPDVLKLVTPWWAQFCSLPQVRFNLQTSLRCTGINRRRGLHKTPGVNFVLLGSLKQTYSEIDRIKCRASSESEYFSHPDNLDLNIYDQLQSDIFLGTSVEYLKFHELICFLQWIDSVHTLGSFEFDCEQVSERHNHTFHVIPSKRNNWSSNPSIPLSPSSNRSLVHRRK